jgi:hypothetical protein
MGICKGGGNLDENLQAIIKELKEINNTLKTISNNLAEVNGHLGGLESILAAAHM